MASLGEAGLSTKMTLESQISVLCKGFGCRYTIFKDKELYKYRPSLSPDRYRRTRSYLDL